MLAFDNLALNLDFAIGIVSHLESVATTTQWRAAYNEVLPKITEFKSKLILDEGLWNALKEYSNSAQATSLVRERERKLSTNARAVSPFCAMRSANVKSEKSLNPSKVASWWRSSRMR